MKFEDVKTIDDRHEHGAWVDGLVNLPGVALKVRGEMNADHESLSQQLWSEVPPHHRENPPPGVAEAIDNECIKKTLLLDWKGFDDLPCTPENIDKLLPFRVFRRAVTYATRVVARNGRAELEASSKN